MKFEFFITLDSILRNGSFAGAAEDMGLSASAVSLQVKRLEEYLGQPLFDRSGRTSKPTPLARELTENVRAALDAVEAARTRQTIALTGRVVLGTIRSLQPTMIPLVLREINRRHPELSVRVIQGDSVELLDQLKAGRLDGAALIRPTSGGSSRLYWEDLTEQPFVFVAVSPEVASQQLGRKLDPPPPPGLPVALQVPVTLGTLQHGAYAVRGGLNAGDQVILGNIFALRSGMAVRPSTAPGPRP